MMRRMGCELAFIEMTSAKGIESGSQRTLDMIQTVPEDKPLGIQLFGHNENAMRFAMDVVNRDHHYAVVDLNAACPVKKVVRRGEGAAMLQEPKRLQSMLNIMVRNTDKPVTVKIRAGWDANSVNARDVALMARDVGVSAVFIHGRTRSQGYGGVPDYGVIRSVVEALDVPVIASGDVLSPELARKMLDDTGCAGLVLARGAMGNPWIFKEIDAYLKKGSFPPRPTIDELLSVLREHMELSVAHYGEPRGVKIFRKFLIWYTRGMHNVKHLRPQASRVTTIAECLSWLEEVRKECSA
jgi:tRNA-dihydrouridine synthase B